MKEVMAVIRMNMINQTKKALLLEDISSITVRKVYGRGKKKISYKLAEEILSVGEVTSPEVGETMSEAHRLIQKRLLTIVAKDDEVSKIIDTILKVNKTGNPGDGKIFVLPVEEAYRVRTGESGDSIL